MYMQCSLQDKSKNIKSMLRNRVDIWRIRIQLTEKMDPDPDEIFHSFDEKWNNFFVRFRKWLQLV